LFRSRPKNSHDGPLPPPSRHFCSRNPLHRRGLAPHSKSDVIATASAAKPEAIHDLAPDRHGGESRLAMTIEAPML
jgi:hypothetical protein